jgi:hypothetical protein
MKNRHERVLSFGDVTSLVKCISVTSVGQPTVYCIANCTNRGLSPNSECSALRFLYCQEKLIVVVYSRLPDDSEMRFSFWNSRHKDEVSLQGDEMSEEDQDGVKIQ